MRGTTTLLLEGLMKMSRMRRVKRWMMKTMHRLDDEEDLARRKTASPRRHETGLNRTSDLMYERILDGIDPGQGIGEGIVLIQGTGMMIGDEKGHTRGKDTATGDGRDPIRGRITVEENVLIHQTGMAVEKGHTLETAMIDVIGPTRERGTSAKGIGNRHLHIVEPPLVLHLRLPSDLDESLDRLRLYGSTTTHEQYHPHHRTIRKTTILSAESFNPSNLLHWPMSRDTSRSKPKQRKMRRRKRERQSGGQSKVWDYRRVQRSIWREK